MAASIPGDQWLLYRGRDVVIDLSLPSISASALPANREIVSSIPDKINGNIVADTLSFI